jgi:hypothetical protein
MDRPYAVIYRTGGTERCQWQRVVGTFTSEQAHDGVEELARMGYHALAVNAARLERVGMPEGWDYQRSGVAVLVQDERGELQEGTTFVYEGEPAVVIDTNYSYARCRTASGKMFTMAIPAVDALVRAQVKP